MASTVYFYPMRRDFRILNMDFRTSFHVALYKHSYAAFFLLPDTGFRLIVLVEKLTYRTLISPRTRML